MHVIWFYMFWFKHCSHSETSAEHGFLYDTVLAHRTISFTLRHTSTKICSVWDLRSLGSAAPSWHLPYTQFRYHWLTRRGHTLDCILRNLLHTCMTFHVGYHKTWVYRRIWWIPRTGNRQSTKSTEIGKKGIMENIARQLKYFGHIKRHSAETKTTLQGKVERRKRTII